AVVPAGTRRYGVGWTDLPKEYEPANPNDRNRGRELTLVGGETQTVEFKLRKKAAAPAPPAKTQPVSAAAAQPDDPPARVFNQTISGRAVDEQGSPIEGATIYLVKTNDIDKVIAEVTTDAGGRYEFRDAPLQSNGVGPWYEMAYFRVVGKA